MTLPNSSVLAERSFELIAPYYDLLMEGVPYGFWLKYLNSIFGHYDHDPFEVLDLACGTGTLTLMLVHEGLVVTGVDLAEPMLSQAIEKAAAANLYVRFEKQDAVTLDLHDSKFDTVISLFDSLNNITDPDMLSECFRRVRHHMRPNGLFVFDLNTAYAFDQGMFNQKSHFKDGPLQYVWTSDYNSRTGLCTITMDFEHKVGDRSPVAFREVHYQRAYSNQELIASLKQSGFGQVDLYDAYTLSPPKKRSDRIFVVARS